MLARARQLPGSTPDPRHAARRRRLERGSDQPGPPQGVGQPRAVGAAADEHDRQPPAEGDGPRVQPRPRQAPRRGERPAGGRDRGLLLRRREREPRHRAVGHQHRALRRPARPADAAPVRVRGQRHRHQRRRRRRAGSPRPSATSRTSSTSRPTASSTTCGTRSAGRSSTCASTDGRRSCTCARCGCGATPAATRSRAYRTVAEIEAVEARDPLLRNARRLVATGAAAPDMLRDLVRETRDRVMAVAEEAARRPRLQTTEEVVAPMAPFHPERVALRAAAPLASRDDRVASFGPSLPEDATAPTGAHPRRRAQRGARRRAAAAARAAPLRRGRRPQGRRLQRHQRPPEALRPGTRLRHAARRDEHPGHRAGRGADRAAAGAGDPVPGLRAQRARPDPRRGGLAPVLQLGPVPQPDGRARPRPGLPEGIRRALPQRQRVGALRDIPGLVLADAVARRRRGAHAARRGRHGRRGRARRRLPRADRALPREGPARRWRRRLAVRLSAPAGDAAARRGRGSTARRTMPTSCSSATPTACA